MRNFLEYVLVFGLIALCGYAFYFVTAEMLFQHAAETVASSWVEWVIDLVRRL